MKKYNHSFLVARFQPFHNGHKMIIDKMLEESKYITIILGSAQESGTDSNPLSIKQRLNLIENIYGKSMPKKFTDNIMNKLIKNKVVRQTLSGMKGEFTEEYLQEFLEPILKNVILEEKNGADFWNTMKDDIGEGLKQLGTQIFNKQNLIAGLEGALTSGLMEKPRNISLDRKGIDVETGRTKNEQKVFESEVNERIKKRSSWKVKCIGSSQPLKDVTILD